MNLLDVLIPSRVTKGNAKNSQVNTIVKNTPLAKPRKVVYGRVTRAGGSQEWNDPEFDFKLIASCLSTESMFRRCVDKYVELIWKNGYKIVGNNPTTVSYIKNRLKQLAVSTRTPFEMMLREMSQQLVTYSNCFLEKVRSREKKVIVNGKEVRPIIGYYPVDATSMKVAKDVNGRVTKFKQVIETVSDAPEWLPDDMIHIVKSREAGLTFGTPMVAPVIDDIRALRRMEENVEMLVFNYAIPLYQYKVGDTDHDADDYQIMMAEQNIKNMPADGMLVTPWYHEVSAVGAEGRAIRMEGYLEYFRERIFSGLGTSAVAMGLGGGANRATSEVLERSMHVTVKEFQKILQIYIEEDIFKELLAEGGFDIGDDNNLVSIFLPEVDLDTKIKLENHVLNMYHGNLLSLDESRDVIGNDPMSEDEYKDTYLFNVDMPKTMVQAVDEPFLATYGTGILKKIGASPALKALQAATPAGVRSAKAADTPSNQYGTKMSPGSTKDEYRLDAVVDAIVEESGRSSRTITRLDYDDYYLQLKVHYDDFRNRVLATIGEDIDISDIKDLVNVYREECVEVMITASENYITHASILGILDVAKDAGKPCDYAPSQGILSYGIDKCRVWLNTTTKAVVDYVMVSLKEDGSSKIGSIFDLNNFRVRLGARNELQRIYNIGYIAAGKVLGYTKFRLISSDSDIDGICRQHEGKEYKIDGSIPYDAVPPGYMTHPLCSCRIELVAQ